MVFHCCLMVFHGFFKELEIHRYSLLDVHQWIHWWISINEFIDGQSMNSLMDIHQWIWSLPLVPFLWAPFFGPFPLGPMGQPLGPMGPGTPSPLPLWETNLPCFDCRLHLAKRVQANFGVPCFIFPIPTPPHPPPPQINKNPCFS